MRARRRDKKNRKKERERKRKKEKKQLSSFLPSHAAKSLFGFGVTNDRRCNLSPRIKERERLESVSRERLG